MHSNTGTAECAASSGVSLASRELLYSKETSNCDKWQLFAYPDAEPGAGFAMCELLSL